MSDLDPLATAPATEASGKKICAGCGTANRPVSVYCYKCGLELPKAIATASGIRPAGFWIRLLALIIDQVFLYAVGEAIFFAAGTPQSGYVYDPGFGLWPIDIVWQVMFPLALEAVYFTVAIGVWGRTIGKAVVRVKVVRTDGGRVSIGRAFGRYIAYILNWLTAGIGFIVIAFNPERRGLHDLIVDTRVIKL